MTRETARWWCWAAPPPRRRERRDAGIYLRRAAAHAAQAGRLLLRDGGQVRPCRLRLRPGGGRRQRQDRRPRRPRRPVPPDLRQPPGRRHRRGRRHDRLRQADHLRPRRGRLQEEPRAHRRGVPRLFRQVLPRDDAGRGARPVRRRQRRAHRDRGDGRAAAAAPRGVAAVVSAVVERLKIRHRLPAARWPTREEAARARLFQPARIGPIVAEQRTWVPAMVPWRATEDGFVTNEVLAWYARFAEGRPGVLVVEATGIRDIASGPLLRIGDDRFVPGLRQLVDTVRDKSAGHTRLFIQAIDFVAVRRRPEPEKFLRRFLEIDTAVRLRLEVLRAARARVGADYVVGIRYLGDDVVAGGSDVQDAAWFGARFAEAGVDYLSVSKGGRFEDAKQPRVGEAVYPYTGRSGYECMPTVLSDARGPFGRNVPLAARIRGAVRETGRDTPIVTSGGIGTFEQAETILERGDADFVGAARQSLADPDWFRKIRLGYGHLVRRCEFTNYCEGLDQQHKQVTCKLWDRVNVDAPDTRLARDGKRRLAPPSWTPPDALSRPSARG